MDAMIFKFHCFYKALRSYLMKSFISSVTATGTTLASTINLWLIRFVRRSVCLNILSPIRYRYHFYLFISSLSFDFLIEDALSVVVDAMCSIWQLLLDTEVNFRVVSMVLEDVSWNNLYHDCFLIRESELS